jgi:hemerythrin-like metal-binding protein
MQKIIWTPDMSVGVEIIDYQHKQFIDIIADLHAALYEHKLPAQISVTLKKLEEYASLHFETEEGYFNKFNYEFKDEHRQEHEKFKKDLISFHERYEKEGIGIAEELVDFSIDWLVEHIEGEDQKYVKCFHDHGLF